METPKTKTKVIKIFGRAGTGKTTAMLKEMEKLFENDVDPRDVAMISHTRAAVGEFVGRAMNRFGFERNDFPYFLTMHSLCYRLLNLNRTGRVTKRVYNKFIEQYYPDGFVIYPDIDEDALYLTVKDKEQLRGDSKLQSMIAINGIMRGCMIHDFNFRKLYKMTGNNMQYVRYGLRQGQEFKWSKKHQKYQPIWTKKIDYIRPEDETDLSINWVQYLVENDFYDYPRILEEAYKYGILPPVKYLFLDEFQDFTLLQFKIYEKWRDMGGMKKIWLAGDDAQALYRFGGGSANYMINTPCDEKIILPKTFRHGRNIFNNAHKYIDMLTVKEPCEVSPADSSSDGAGEVIQCYDDEWLSEKYLSFEDDETVLILAATDVWAKQLRARVTNWCPDVYFANLGDTREMRRVFRMYNTIAAIERGETIPWEWNANGGSNGGSGGSLENDDSFDFNGHSFDFGLDMDYAPIKFFSGVRRAFQPRWSLRIL